MSRRGDTYGLLAEFGDALHLLAGARAARDAGYTRLDAFTPFPVHGLSAAMGWRESKLGWIVLAGGLAGCLGGFFLQWYTSVVAYPINVGGRPFNSWPAFMIITFELTILSAGVTAVIAMVLLNGLPRLHHPLFNVPDFEMASHTHFFLCVEARDPKFDREATAEFLRQAGATRVIEVPYEHMVPSRSPETPPPPNQARVGEGPPTPTESPFAPPRPGPGPLPGLLLACVLLLGACDNVNRGMDNEGRLEVYEPSPFFEGEQSVRPLVAGTVPRGGGQQSEHLYQGKIDGKLADTFPLEITRAVLERGRERYEIYCAVCHNATGDGQGMIVLRGFVPPPSFHIERLREVEVGHFFDVITNGWGAMYSYNDRVSVEDRWAIAAYIRVLQLSQHVEPGMLSPEERAKAEGGGP